MDNMGIAMIIYMSTHVAPRLDCLKLCCEGRALSTTAWLYSHRKQHSRMRPWQKRASNRARQKHRHSYNNTGRRIQEDTGRMATRAVLQTFERYQKERVSFVTTVAEMAKNPQVRPSREK